MRTVWAMVDEDDDITDAVFATKEMCEKACDSALGTGYGKRECQPMTLVEEGDRCEAVKVWIAHVTPDRDMVTSGYLWPWQDYTTDYTPVYEGGWVETWRGEKDCMIFAATEELCREHADDVLARMRRG